MLEPSGSFQTSAYNMPLELLQFLTEINRNITDVKERVIRIEAQDHSVTIKSLRKELEDECERRQKLADTVLEMKTRQVPLLAGLSGIGAVVLNYILRATGH